MNNKYHYTKIDDLTLNELTIYFRTPLCKDMIRATAFTNKYLYFHTPSILNNNASDIKTLGKFIQLSRRSSGSIYDDYDYVVYEFELGSVNCKRDGQIDGEIYLVGIPDSDEGMTLVENMSYKGWPVFYLKA